MAHAVHELIIDSGKHLCPICIYLGSLGVRYIELSEINFKRISNYAARDGQMIRSCTSLLSTKPTHTLKNLTLSDDCVCVTIQSQELCIALVDIFIIVEMQIPSMFTLIDVKCLMIQFSLKTIKQSLFSQELQKLFSCSKCLNESENEKISERVGLLKISKT